ncbi:unnamed protein product [Durusdinium trenchii]|uniref:phosphoserine transaminase n=1 Tax=Durusdinium trenchii TaxID=1381693 RepID=A0ABP0LXW0_9DINO
MNGHSGDQVDALRSLDPHDAKTVAKQLCYRIPESKDSLYFILRGLGLPVTGELGSTPRVEVDAKEYPTLWRALDCLRVPHDGKLMVIKAESPSLDALCGKPAEKRGVQRPTSAVKGGPPAPPAPEPREEIEPIRSVPSSRPQSASCAENAALLQRVSFNLITKATCSSRACRTVEADPNSFLHEHAWQQAPVPQGRVYNFSAGPSAMPLEVLEEVQREMVNYKGCGMSVMEMSHRSKEFMAIAAEAEKNLRDIFGVPSDYKVLMMQGGATLQFSSIPLNMLGSKTKADYLVTGQWGEKAHKECNKYGTGQLACNTKGTKFTTIPQKSEWKLDPEAAYVHYCANETVNGVEFSYTPDVDTVPLVADMSSNFCSKPIEVSKHAFIYAGIQKNLGPAGMSVGFLRPDFADGSKELKICPTYCSFKTTGDNGSMYNTPACFTMYVMGEYLKYTKKLGGLAYWAEQSDKKSGLLYGAIDGSNGFYNCPVEKTARSRMNVPFTINGGDEALEKKFLDEAKKHKLYTLAGHRSVGGCRASLYNGLPLEGAVLVPVLIVAGISLVLLVLFSFDTLEYQVNSVLFSDEDAGKKQGPALQSRTRDGLNVRLEVSFQYRLKFDRVYDLYATLGSDYEPTFLRMAIEQLATAATDHSAHFFFTNRTAISAPAADKTPGSKQERAFSEVPFFQLRTVHLPHDFEEAIRETQVKQQDIQIATLEQKTKTVTFKTRVLQAEQDVKVLVNQAHHLRHTTCKQLDV